MNKLFSMAIILLAIFLANTAAKTIWAKNDTATESAALEGETFSSLSNLSNFE